jgi:hypothetical protein
MKTLTLTSFLLSAMLAAGLLLVGCSASTPMPTETPSATPDPCAPEQIATEASKVHQLTREFDDTAFVAAHTPQAQLPSLIMALQKTRRAAEDQPVPMCLAALKKAQLEFMNAMINTLTNFMGGAAADEVKTQIATAERLLAVYNLELARLTGATVVPVPSPTTGPTRTPAPVTPTTATPEAVIPVTGTTPTGTQPPATISATDRVNIRAGPGTDYNVLGVLNPGETAVAVGRSADSQWIQIKYAAAEGGVAWVAASAVTLNVPVETLPVVTP